MFSDGDFSGETLPDDDAAMTSFADQLFARFGERAVALAEHQATLANEDQAAIAIVWRRIADLVRIAAETPA